jgi:hypothetical protein
MQQIASMDFNKAGMNAWNSLTILLDKDDKLFDDVMEFEQFYFMVMDKLMAEEKIDA